MLLCAGLWTESFSMLFPPHGPWLTAQTAPSTIRATVMGWMLLMLILDLARATQGDKRCPCPLSWGTPEPPSPVVAGQWCQLWMPPSNQTGRGKEQDLCCREGGGVWQGGHCREAELLRSELMPCWSLWHVLSPCLSQRCQNFSAAELGKSWLRKLLSSACFSAHMSGSPISGSICVEGFWLGSSVNRDPKQSFFLGH